MRKTRCKDEQMLGILRACALLPVSRSTPRFEPRLLAKGALVVAAIWRLSEQYPRCGLRRPHIFLALDGKLRRECLILE